MSQRELSNEYDRLEELSKKKEYKNEKEECIANHWSYYEKHNGLFRTSIKKYEYSDRLEHYVRTEEIGTNGQVYYRESVESIEDERLGKEDDNRTKFCGIGALGSTGGGFGGS